MAQPKSKRKPVAEVPTEAVVKRRDVRPFLYAGLDLAFGILYIVIFTTLAVNRHTWAMVILWSLPVVVIVMGLATLVGAVMRGPSRRLAWIAAVSAGTAMLVLTIVLLGLLLASAAFLSGVYGAFGKAAASGVLAGAALVVELVAILPALQVKYLLTRAGRRAFGLPALWRKPAVAA